MSGAETATDAPAPVAKPAGSEETGSRRTEWQFLCLLAGFSRPFRGRLALLAVLTLVRSGSLGATIYFLNRSIVSLFAGGQVHLPDLLLAVGGLLLCQVVAALAQYFAEDAQRRFLERMEVATLLWAIGHLVKLPADYFRTRLLAKMVYQVQKVQTIVRTYVNSMLSMATRSCMILGILGGLLLQAPFFAALSVTILVVMAYLAYRRAYYIRYLERDEDESDVSLIERILTIFSNLRDVHSFGLTQQSVQQFDDSCQALVARVAQKARAHGGIGLLLNGAGILVLAAAALVVLGGSTGKAGALTCFAAMGMVLDPLSDLVRTRITLQGRLFKIGELFQIVERLQAQRQPDGQKVLETPLEVLEFDRVAYQVHGVHLLQHITFRVRRGEILGIVGRSGAGKSTLATVALRLLDPTAGRICANGVELRDMDLSSYWQQSAYVAQVPCRINATLREEVAFARPGAEAAEIDQALAAAGIDPALHDRSLEPEDGDADGSQTAWHTRSLQQRTEWARLHVRSPRLVVLDEPTSLVDAAEEQRFVRDLLARREDRITILISHRPGTLAACDRLLVLEGGRITAQGARAEILSQWWPRLEQEGNQAS